MDHRLEAGKYIKDRREKRGMSQRQLADAVGMITTALAAVEIGRNSVPPDRYEQMADALGAPHPEFAKIMLKATNPWLYAMFYPGEIRPNELKAIRDRLPNDRLH